MANCVSNYELMHYGVRGMKWGVHRAKRSTDSNGLARASKRYDKKVSRGSLHNVIGLAFENQGMKKAADRQYKKGNFKETKWAAKANRARNVKKVYDSYIKDLSKLEKSGRGNDVNAIIARSKLYDRQITELKDQYRAQITQARKAIYGE